MLTNNLSKGGIDRSLLNMPSYLRVMVDIVFYYTIIIVFESF